MKDLFGDEVEEPKALPPGGKRRSTVPNGYAARPGTGPAGETCKTCKHICRHRWSKVYLKCGMAKGLWTHGPGSDIKASSPACAKWEKPDE